MEPNEALEKIYISTNSQDGTYYISNQYKRLIEYTRTDAFVEKACTWLKENCKNYIVVDIDNKYEGIDGLFLEDFRKYMEGEEV